MGESRKLAVIGDPISHSLSPLLHNTMARELNCAYEYEAQRVTPQGLSHWIQRVKSKEFYGFNATMPHKIHVLPYLHQLTPEAAMLGAVNTVKNMDGILIGHNTDGDGFYNMLLEHGLDFKDRKIAILGAGGSAVAIGKTGALLGARKITMHNRTLKKAVDICGETSCMEAKTLLDDVDGDTDILINTIPVGSYDEMAVLKTMKKSCTVVDILYNPSVTPLMEAAKNRGMETYNGMGMLIHQGILAFRFFTGAEFETKKMAEILYQAVEQ